MPYILHTWQSIAAVRIWHSSNNTLCIIIDYNNPDSFTHGMQGLSIINCCRDSHLSYKNLILNFRKLDSQWDHQHVDRHIEPFEDCICIGHYSKDSSSRSRLVWKLCASPGQHINLYSSRWCHNLATYSHVESLISVSSDNIIASMGECPEWCHYELECYPPHGQDTIVRRHSQCFCRLGNIYTSHLHCHYMK